MATRAAGSMDMKSWDEKPYHEMDGGHKLTRADIATLHEGDIVGEGMLAYLLSYRADGTGVFMGYERIVGRVGARSGSFVLKHEGIFQPNGVKCSTSIVPGSGTGELRGLRGEGSYIALHGMKTPYTLDYELAADPASFEVDIEGAQQPPQTKPDLLERIEADRRELESLIDSLSDDQLARPGKDGGWSIKDHLAHLAMWEAGVAALLRKQPRWEAMGLTRDIVARSSEEEINAMIERNHKALSLAEVRKLFADSHRAMLDALETLTTEDLHRPVNSYEPVNPSDNERPVGGLVVGNTTAHYAEHLEWIRALVDGQP